MNKSRDLNERELIKKIQKRFEKKIRHKFEIEIEVIDEKKDGKPKV